MHKTAFIGSNRRTVPPLRDILRDCQHGGLPADVAVAQLRYHPSLMRKLGLHRVLSGHEGCVNTLEWNAGGDMLVSGSDDKCIVLWDSSGNQITRFASGHNGNIFAAKFMHESDDSRIVSGAADGAVIVTQWRDTGGNAAVRLRAWKKSKRVKQVVLNTVCSTTFYSCSEDGKLFEYDIRSDEPSLLYSSQRGIKSIATTPGKPEQIAASVSEKGVILFDLRKMDTPLLKFEPSNAYVMESFRDNVATHVEFNRQGTELLAFYSNGSIYVYDTTLDPDADPKFPERTNAALEKFNEKSIENRFKVPNVAEEGGCATTMERLSRLINDLEYRLIDTDLSGTHDVLTALATTYFLRGNVFRGRNFEGDVFDAIRDYVRSLEALPGNATVVLPIFRALQSMYQFTEAKEWLKLMADKPAEVRLTGKETRKVWKTESTTRDYSERYCGTRNVQTDIKQARFCGPNDEYIVAGSDCGHLFVYERGSNAIVKILQADKHVLNCAAPHPNSTLIATSGIEDKIRFWSPCFSTTPEELDENNSTESTDATADADNIFMRNDIGPLRMAYGDFMYQYYRIRQQRPEWIESCRTS